MHVPETVSQNVIELNLSMIDRALATLQRIGIEDYQRSAKIIYGSSCGSHFRHIIQHYEGFLSGVGTGEVDYDQRDRDAESGRDPKAAERALREIRNKLSQLAHGGTLRVQQNHNPALSAPSAFSSVERELQFLLSHTVHHFAVIGIAMHSYGISLPDDFALAPSTAFYLQSRAMTSAMC